MFIDLSSAARGVQPTPAAVAPRRVPLRRTESCLTIGGINNIEWLAGGINEIKKLETSFGVLLSPKEKPAQYVVPKNSLEDEDDWVERKPPAPVLSPPSVRQANPLERQKHSFFRLPSLLSLIQTMISPKKSQGTAPRPTERKSKFSNIRDISSSTSRKQPASSSTPGGQRESAMAIDPPSSRSSRRSEEPLQREEMECFFVSLLRAEAENTPAHELGGAPKAQSRSLRRRVLDDQDPGEQNVQSLSRKAKPTPKVLGSEHYQRGALHIPYECYEKVILPGKEGREGYHIPIGAAMQQYNPCRKILVTAESLASFEGVTAPILKKYKKKHFMTRKRIYADGIYVDKAITIEQELDDCDKDDKGRENVTITVLPNQFVYAVIGEEVKGVDVKPSYFGPGMDEDLDSVRDKKICDSILIDQKYDQTFGRKRLEDVDVVWPEEEVDRPAKRVRYSGVLTVVVIYTDTAEKTDDDVEE